MDPRPTTDDPLAAALADLESLEARPVFPGTGSPGDTGSPDDIDGVALDDEVEVFCRIHTALASALAGAAAERPGPAPGPGR